MINEVDFGPECKPIPQGLERWWEEGTPGLSLQLVEADTVAHPRALCNDGTAATYYARAGIETDRWVVHLQGGGLCVDHDSCMARWCYNNGSDYSAEMMSSLYSFETLSTGGITDADPIRSKFATWNHVWVQSCSSDAFMGTAMDVALDSPVNPDESFRLHFLGRDILNAILDELEWGTPLLAELGMPSLTDARTVLLTGTTSGGIGVIHNLDRVATRLQSTNPGVDVRGVLDSATYPAADIWVGAPYTGLYDPDTLWRYELLSAPSELYGFERTASCATLHDPLLDSWWCDERMHVLTNHVATPFFAFVDQVDAENPLCAGDPSCADLFRAQYQVLPLIADAGIPREAPPVYDAAGPLPGFLVPRCGTTPFGAAHAPLTQPDGVGFLNRKMPVGDYVPGASTWLSYHDALWSWVEQDGGVTGAVRTSDLGTPDCPDPPPSTPTNVVVTYNSETDTVTLTWNPLPFARTMVVGYATVEPLPPDASTFPPLVNAELTYVDVAPGGDRRCYGVRGENDEGMGPWSVTTCVDLPGDIPDNVTPTGDSGVDSDTKKPPKEECGCDSGSPYGSVAWWIALGLVGARRGARNRQKLHSRPVEITVLPNPSLP